MHDSITLTVYRSGQPYTTIGDPYMLESWAESSGIPASELSFDLAEIKKWKEEELRDHADGWYRDNVRSFEGTMVSRKERGGSSLIPEEAAIRDSMVTNYDRMKALVASARSKTTWRDVLAVRW